MTIVFKTSDAKEMQEVVFQINQLGIAHDVTRTKRGTFVLAVDSSKELEAREKIQECI